MAKTQQGEQDKDLGQDQREALSNVIGEQVLHTLGAPGDLLKVQVRPLWEDRYRVNVLVGGNAASARVAHSYFLVADGDGNITAATPKIARQY